HRAAGRSERGCRRNRSRPGRGTTRIPRAPPDRTGRGRSAWPDHSRKYLARQIKCASFGHPERSMATFIDAIIESFRLTSSQLQFGSPRLLGALLILTVGWLIARSLRRIAIKVLRLLRLESVSERAGVEDFLMRGGVRFTAVTLIGNALYWALLL